MGSDMGSMVILTWVYRPYNIKYPTKGPKNCRAKTIEAGCGVFNRGKWIIVGGHYAYWKGTVQVGTKKLALSRPSRALSHSMMEAMCHVCHLHGLDAGRKMFRQIFRRACNSMEHHEKSQGPRIQDSPWQLEHAAQFAQMFLWQACLSSPMESDGNHLDHHLIICQLYIPICLIVKTL